MNKNTPLYTGLILAQTILLYSLAGAFISILLALINYWIADPLSYLGSGPYFAMSVVVIAVPLFLVISRYLNTMYSSVPQLIESPVKKWLGYFTLFVGGAILSGDLIAVVYSFFNGDLVSSFLWSALAVAAIIGWFFYSVLHEVRLTNETHTGKARLYNAIVFVVVAVSLVVLGLVAYGTPDDQRLKKIDTTISNTLGMISNDIYQYNAVSSKLPVSLNELQNVSQYTSDIEDARITYTATSDTTYTLCADFNTDTIKNSRNTSYAPAYYYGDIPDYSRHTQGTECFDIRVVTDAARKGLLID